MLAVRTRVVVSHEAEVEPEPVASIEEEDLDYVVEVYDPLIKTNELLLLTLSHSNL